MTSSPDAQTAEGSKERRPSNAMLRRLSGQNSTLRGGRGSPLHLSPKAGTLRLGASGYQSDLHVRAPSSSSIATMTHRALYPPNSGRSFSAIESGSSSDEDDEGAAEEEEEQQAMEKEEASRRIRELERLVNPNTMQFAQSARSHVSPSPVRTRLSAQKPQSPASSSVNTDRYEASASASPTSPPSAGVPPQGTARRGDMQSSLSPPASVLQRGRQELRVSTSDRTANSTAPSTSSSFSDISDVSTSAFEEAAGTSVRPAVPSRLTVFARNHLGRHY
ncbi:hypothetical protein DACRYDRAFT_19513 [Dacryopinax primogenitus]|uniref:Uncharacterized protein n=1 Tax=Dacryopinax primogenitus (strain DJM 731) TaxID=1858805 RepID=M5GBF5_DACPD|nr:uncharacterized protein DACRYDRAFT_19513 [Dacryopinax primogenitus]EJU06284.1 hypothetical protein DACRYDRAFT_19513 [Dacryopinax primogenitus]